jgi:type IV pilus assembly protein PilC
MLDKVADYYDEEVREATEQLIALMEPVMILILAGIVGSIVFAIVLPMGSMVSALDNI